MNEVPSIADVLIKYQVDNSDASRLALHAELVAREAALCDMLRMAGAQFNLFPQVVAEVLAEVGLGAPMSADERELIRTQFTGLMEQLRRDQEER